MSYLGEAVDALTPTAFAGLEGRDLSELPARERFRVVQRWMRARAPEPIRHVVFLVCYDISDDKVRRYVADYLLREGLTRMQKSVFIGKRPVAAYRELARRLKEANALYANEDSIVVVPIPEDKAYRMRVIGTEFDVRLALARPNVIVV